MDISAILFLLILYLTNFVILSRAQITQESSTSCGPYSVPFAVNVDVDGRPELFCEVSECFDQTNQPYPTQSTKEPELFHSTLGAEEFVEKKDPNESQGNFFLQRRRRRHTGNVIAICNEQFGDTVCDLPNEWTGALVEVNNGTHISLQMQCCVHDGLEYQATGLRTAILKPGDHYLGGPVIDDGKMVAFDLVKEVRKNVTEENEVRYVLSIYRMLCVKKQVPTDQTSPIRDQPQGMMGELLESYDDQKVDSLHYYAPRLSTFDRLYDRAPLALRRLHRLAGAAKSEVLRKTLERIRAQRRRMKPQKRTKALSKAKDIGIPRMHTTALLKKGRTKLKTDTNYELKARNSKRVFEDRKRGSQDLYRPLVDEYDYYEMGPLPLLLYSKLPYYRRGSRIRSRIEDNNLWPIPAYSGGHSMSKQRLRPRLYSGTGAFMTQNQIPIKPGDDIDYQFVDSPTTEDVPPNESGPIAVATEPSVPSVETVTSIDLETSQDYTAQTLMPAIEQIKAQLPQKEASYTMSAGTYVEPPVQVSLPIMPARDCPNGGTCPSSSGGSCSGSECGQSAPAPAVDVQPFAMVPETCNACGCQACICPGYTPPPCTESSCPCPTECGCPSSCTCPTGGGGNEGTGGTGDGTGDNRVIIVDQNQGQGYNPEQGQGYNPQQGYDNQYYQGANPQYYQGGNSFYVPATGGSPSLLCFSADMRVQTTEGDKSMHELKVGDLVLSIEESLISYSPVVMFLHRKPEEIASYRHLETGDGQRLKLTDFHLIWMNRCVPGERLQLAYAKDLMVGDCVHIISQPDNRTSVLYPSRVVRIEQVEETGIYAPLTANGNIFVNGILASCHSNMVIQTLQQTFFAWWRTLNAWTRQFRSVFWPVFSYTMNDLWGGGCRTSDNFAKQLSDSLNPDVDGTCQSIPAADGFSESGDDGELPFGVSYLIEVMEVFVPKNVYQL